MKPQNQPPPSRCDNYDEYLEDELGYTYVAGDVVALAELESHDRLQNHPLEELGERKLVDLNDFEALGFARGLKEAGNLDGFARAIEALLESDDDHPGVEYAELPLLGALALYREGEHNRALSWLEYGIEEWPQRRTSASLLQGRILLNQKGPEAAIEHFESLANSNDGDPEVFFEISEALAVEGHPELARNWLDRARERAGHVGARALLVDIDVLEHQLTPDGRDGKTQ